MNEYSQEWKRYRRLVIYWVAIFAAYVPVVMAVSVLFEKLFRTDAAFPYVASFWACLWVASFLRICAFPCPRCGECFIGGSATSSCSANVLIVDCRETLTLLRFFLLAVTPEKSCRVTGKVRASA